MTSSHESQIFIMASKLGNPFQKVFNLLDLDIFEESGLPKCSVVKNPSANVGDMGLIPGLGRSPGKGNGNPL